MRNFWRFLRPVFPASRVQQVSDLHSIIRTKATPCVEVCDSMRIGKEKKKEEEKRRKIETTAAKYNGLSITMGGHKYCGPQKGANIFFVCNLVKNQWILM